MVDDALVPSRNACTRLKQPFQRLAAGDLHSNLRMCLHTTGNLWTLLTVTGIRNSPPELSLEVVTWPA